MFGVSAAEDGEHDGTAAGSTPPQALCSRRRDVPGRTEANRNFDVGTGCKQHPLYYSGQKLSICGVGAGAYVTCDVHHRFVEGTRFQRGTSPQPSVSQIKWEAQRRLESTFKCGDHQSVSTCCVRRSTFRALASALKPIREVYSVASGSHAFHCWKRVHLLVL